MKSRGRKRERCEEVHSKRSECSIHTVLSAPHLVENKKPRLRGAQRPEEQGFDPFSHSSWPAADYSMCVKVGVDLLSGIKRYAQF